MPGQVIGSFSPSGSAPAKPEYATWIPAAVLGLVHLVMAVLFLLGRASGTDAALTGFPLDDSWIHLVYAKSLAWGGGFSYNPGQPETGFTSPLWVVLLAPQFWIQGLSEGWQAVLWPKLLGTLAAWATSFLCFRLALKLTGRLAPAWVAGIMLAVDPMLGFARISGMEIALATAALSWTLLALAENRPGRAGIGLALCLLSRPELALVAALAAPIVLIPAWRLSRFSQGFLSKAALLLGPSAVAMATWAAYNFLVTGHAFPATFYVKHAPARHAAHFLSTFSDAGFVAVVLAGSPWFAWGLGIPLVTVGLWKLARLSNPAATLLVASAVLLPIGLVWAHDFKQVWPFYWTRYLMPALPLLYLALAAGADAAWEAWKRGRRIVAMTLAVFFAAGAAMLPERLVSQIRLYSWNCRNINEVQVALGEWVRAHSRPLESIATNDAGAIRFFGERATVDIVGLNNHALLFGQGARVMMQHSPRYLIVFTSWFPGIEQNPTLRRVHSARSERYTIIDSDQDEMVVFERAAPPP